MTENVLIKTFKTMFVCQACEEAPPAITCPYHIPYHIISSVIPYHIISHCESCLTWRFDYAKELPYSIYMIHSTISCTTPSFFIVRRWNLKRETRLCSSHSRPLDGGNAAHVVYPPAEVHQRTQRRRWSHVDTQVGVMCCRLFH